MANYLSQPLNQQIAQYIYARAPAYGVDPNVALGIAYYEGLNRANPLANNPDGAGNTAYGFFQLGSRYVAPQIGIGPNSASTDWQSYTDKTLAYMGSHGYKDWNSVGDVAGTHGDNSNTSIIGARGASIASQNGLAGGDLAPGGSTWFDSSGVLTPAGADALHQYENTYGTGFDTSGLGVNPSPGSYQNQGGYGPFIMINLVRNPTLAA
jgi:hypothetical protein